ncbi:flagellar motor protein [Leeia sp. IMCC25680]|uniref:Flagellar motor protein n=2 Tax=Leeia aquatica TaxID=2725557 RepID=A0A847S513_9NEIS|nr:flagellar motor protein [Leeia aquatica]
MRFDYLSLTGILLSFVAILGGQLLEGGHIGSLLQLTAFLIVLGGTTGAVMLQYPLPIFWQGVRMLRWIVRPPQYDLPALLNNLVTWSQLARRGGLLALEPRITDQKDDFNRKGLQLLVDGVEPNALRSTLWIELETRQDNAKRAARVWESAGGYAPTIGILGAVMGLIHVMENLSDPSKLGAGIAVAFVATIYGVGSANLLFLPIANKLKQLVQEESVQREMYIEGLCAIANGENPRIIEAKLRGYLGSPR